MKSVDLNNLVSKIGILNTRKFPGIRGSKALMASNPRDSLKRRSQNKTTMNFSKESTELKTIGK
jgi:hypothetical protein